MIRHFGKDKAIVVGHDWGGAVAWSLATNAPQFVERLIILNLPHLRGLNRELARNPEQQKNSQYARNFQEDGSEKNLTPEGLAGWVRDAEAKPKYIEAFKKSSFVSRWRTTSATIRASRTWRTRHRSAKFNARC